MYRFIKFFSYFIIVCSLSIAGIVLYKQQSTMPNAITAPINFNQAKRLARKIHAKYKTTFYCGCLYNDQNNQIDLQSCGYKIQNNSNNKRANRVEWEHIVPASTFGQKLPCWTNKLCCDKNGCSKGRSCCQKIDPRFSKMEADLHNIVPVIGELNALRSDYNFAELHDIEAGQFGSCYIKIDKIKHLVEPRSEVKGVIARAYLYMIDLYKIPIAHQQKKLFLKWNQEYLPSQWEIVWNKQVTKVQGNNNSYISKTKDITNKRS